MNLIAIQTKLAITTDATIEGHDLLLEEINIVVEEIIREDDWADAEGIPNTQRLQFSFVALQWLI